MKSIYIITIAFLHFLSYQKSVKTPSIQTKKEHNIICTDNSCSGSYTGPEFINRSDVAHQFSNTMSGIVGDHLKALYRNGTYSKVDFPNIKMTTKGMGSGQVTYFLSIPFIKVNSKCEAYTSFDHVGGWNHAPELAKRKSHLQKLLLQDHNLDISDLKKTPEGLQEHWIQWKHKEVQKECE